MSFIALRLDWQLLFCFSYHVKRSNCIAGMGRPLDKSLIPTAHTSSHDSGLIFRVLFAYKEIQ
jgi:hypothetical protein